MCSGCGTRQREWDEDRFAFVAETTRCRGCELLAIESDHLPKDAKGARVFLLPRSVAVAQMTR